MGNLGLSPDFPSPENLLPLALDGDACVEGGRRGEDHAHCADGRDECLQVIIIQLINTNLDKEKSHKKSPSGL